MFDRLVDDKDTLEGFIDDFNVFIGDLVAERWSYFIVAALRDELRDAWLSDQNQDRIADLKRSIDQFTDAAMANHGFVGPGLTAKINVVRYLHQRFIQRGGSALLKRVIDALENLLDSIIDAAGIGSGIKELKEAIKGAIDED